MLRHGRGIHKAAVVLLDEGGVQLGCNEGWMGGQALQKGLVSRQATHLKGRQQQLKRQMCLCLTEQTWVRIDCSPVCMHVLHIRFSYVFFNPANIIHFGFSCIHEILAPKQNLESTIYVTSFPSSCLGMSA